MYQPILRMLASGIGRARWLLLAAFVLLWLSSPSDPALASPLSGIISQDTTWAVADSPFEVTGDVQVPTGVTLTI